jgi:cullin-associated NEDD8-dissociated protein 1
MQVGVAASKDADGQGPAVLQRLQADCGDVLKAACRQLRDKSLRTRSGVLLALKELLAVVPKCLSGHVEQLLQGLKGALSVRRCCPLSPQPALSQDLCHPAWLLCSKIPPLCAAQDRSSSSSSQLKIHALQFLRAALAASDAPAWQPHVRELLPPVTAAAGERYSKVAAEALRVCEELVHVIRPSPLQAVPSSLQARRACPAPCTSGCCRCCCC